MSLPLCAFEAVVVMRFVLLFIPSLFVDPRFPCTWWRTNHANCQSLIFAWTFLVSHSPPHESSFDCLSSTLSHRQIGRSQTAARDILEQHRLCLAPREEDALITHLCLLEQACCVIMSQWVCHLFWSHYRCLAASCSPHLCFAHPQQVLLTRDFLQCINSNSWLARLWLVPVNSVLRLLLRKTEKPQLLHYDPLPCSNCKVQPELLSNVVRNFLQPTITGTWDYIIITLVTFHNISCKYRYMYLYYTTKAVSLTYIHLRISDLRAPEWAPDIEPAIGQCNG